MYARTVLPVTVMACIASCRGDVTTQDDSGPDVVDAASDLGILGFDVSAYDAGYEPDGPDAAGCLPVACPDADYYITITGDGPDQVLRSNNDTLGEYPFPVQRFTPPGGEPGFDEVWGSSTMDGGAQFQLFIDGVGIGTLFYQGASGTGYCFDPGYCPDPFGDAGPGFSVTITTDGPPGSVVRGSYAAPAGDFFAPDAGRYLSGTFVTCRLCDAPPIP